MIISYVVYLNIYITFLTSSFPKRSVTIKQKRRMSIIAED